MHAIFFGVKRVHIEVVRLTRRMIWLSNLTPARFDLMRIVQLYPDGVAQGTIQWLLGVSAPVVSRMLKALQQLGFVERERHRRDGRARWVTLTERGAIATRVAASATLVNLEAERTAARAVTGNNRRESASYDEILHTIEHAKGAVAEVDAFLTTMRAALEDRAAFHHPWLPISERMPPMIFTTMVDGRLRYGDEDLLALLA
jgi:DNA-binding MarR family transcriptional regulator